jgi:hypothetical protein
MPLLLREARMHKRFEYHYLDISNVASTRAVEFVPSRKLTCGSTQKALQAIRLVKSVFRKDRNRVVTHGPDRVVIVCPSASEAEILGLCTIAEQRLARLREELLTAKMVEEILSITSAERRHWSKDGRIPTAGSAFFSRGKKQVGLFLYSPDVIDGLVARPDQIADWRRNDSGGSEFHEDDSPTKSDIAH